MQFLRLYVIFFAYCFPTELNEVIILGVSVEFPQLAAGWILCQGVLKHDLLCGNHAPHRAIEYLIMRQFKQLAHRVISKRIQAIDDIFGDTGSDSVFSGIDFIELLLQPYAQMLLPLVFQPFAVFRCNFSNTVLGIRRRGRNRFVYLCSQIKLVQLGPCEGDERICHIGAEYIPFFVSSQIIFSSVRVSIVLSVLDVIERGLLGLNVCIGFLDQFIEIFLHICFSTLKGNGGLIGINIGGDYIEGIAHLTKCVFAVMSRWVGFFHLGTQYRYIFFQLIVELCQCIDRLKGTVWLPLEHTVTAVTLKYDRSCNGHIKRVVGLLQIKIIIHHIAGLVALFIQKTVVFQLALLRG